MKKVFILFTIICLFALVKYQYYLILWNDAENDPDINIISKFENIEQYLQNDEKFLFSYYQKLIEIDFNFQKANIILDKLICRKANRDLFIKSGDLKLILGDTNDALKRYYTASNIVPLAQIPKYKIMNVYTMKNDTANALIWMNRILKTNVKIRSPTVDTIQKRVNFLFHNLYKNNLQ